MPVIIFEGPRMTKEQKEQLVKEFTLTGSRITNLSPEKFTTLIREYEPENVGAGTNLLVNIIKKE
ncbi:MAG: 4-oxalocrotonate tautomerase DmpI [Bacillota bacterium]